MTEIKKIALNSLHESLGASMVNFAGYHMPVRYTSDKEEHLAVRNAVGVFDVSHMGEFMIRGEKAVAFLQKIVSNDVSRLFDGKALYAYLPNENGGIVDDLLVYRMAEDEYMLVVNASNIEKDWNWISQYKDEFGVELENISDNISLFAVQGPQATEALQSLTKTDLKAMTFYTFKIDEFAGVPNVIISATGYTGAGGFELYVPNEYAEEVWNKVFDAGKDFDIKPIGLGARDTLRLEMGYCLYGNDIDDITSPIEAGLAWVTKFDTNFINAENLRVAKEAGVSQRLVGFKMIDRGIPRKDYEIVDAEENMIGKVTSGSLSPLLNVGIGMAYIQKPFHKKGSEIFVKVRKKLLKAEVVKMPFV